MKKTKAPELPTRSHIIQGNIKNPMDFSDDESDENESCWGNLSKDYCSFNPQHDIFQLCTESTLHGLKYIGQPDRHIVDRLFWVSSILALIGVTAYLIQVGVVEPYFKSPILISFESSETTIEQVPFPAFTICNANKIKQTDLLKEATKNLTLYYELINKKEKPVYIPSTEYLALQYLHLQCEGSKGFLKAYGYSDDFGKIEHGDDGRQFQGHELESYKGASRIYNNAFHKCEDMLLLCLWQQQQVACDELFHPITTEFGFCCTFNMMPLFILRKMEQNDRHVSIKEQNMTKDIVKKWSSWNVDKHLVYKDQGGDSTEKSKNDDYPRHQTHPGVSNGLSILLNPELESYHCMGQDSEGFRAEVHSTIDSPNVVDFGKAVKPGSETFFSITAEITLADEELASWNPEDRKCYFSGDYNLTTSKFYTHRNCLDECITNITYKECNCVRYFMPRPPEYNICDKSKYECAMDVKKNMTRSGVSKTCPMCLPACVHIDYSADISWLPLREDVNLWKNFTTHLDERWVNDSLSIIHVDYVSGSVETKVRKSLYGFNNIIANAGGVLGLTLGFSVISIVEPIYFLTLRSWCKFRTRKDEKVHGSHVPAENEVRIWTSSKSLKPADAQKHWTKTLHTKRVLVYPSDFIKGDHSNLKPRLIRSIKVKPHEANAEL